MTGSGYCSWHNEKIKRPKNIKVVKKIEIMLKDFNVCDTCNVYYEGNECKKCNEKIKMICV